MMFQALPTRKISHLHLHRRYRDQVEITTKSLTPSQKTKMPPIDFRENPVAPEIKEKFESKAPSQYFDPCQDAADRSLKCLKRNMGDRDMCLDYFQAYRDCKKKWIDDRKKARFSGTSWAKTDSSTNNDEDSTAAKS